MQDASLWNVLREVAAERARQDAKFGVCDMPHMYREEPPVVRAVRYPLVGANYARNLAEQHHRDGTGSWMDVLIEELAEAAEEGDDIDKFRTEVLHVVAVGVACIESIDRKRAGALGSSQG